jgi:antitoxin YefM
MYTIYRINANELDGRFVRAMKAMFKNKEIEIAVCEAAQTENDETAYLLKSPANKKRLLQAIENVEHNRGLVAVTLDELQ